MSVRYRIIHKELVSDQEVEYRADILDSEYSGSVQEKRAGGVFFDWQYDQVDEREPFRTPVQKSSFDVKLWIQNSTDEAILTDILDSDENRFQIEFYIDGVRKWVGNILTDLVEYNEADYPYMASIKAKDLSRLEGEDFEQVSNRTSTRLIEIIAECFGATGLNLPIRSFTNVTNSEVDQSQDFLYSLYHQKYALQQQNEALTKFEVLENICRAYNLIIRQSNAIWYIEQLPAVAKGDDTQFDYDSSGAFLSSSTPSRTVNVDNDTYYLLPTSVNKVTGALKRSVTDYKHRTPIVNIDVEDVTYNSQPAVFESFTGEPGEGDWRLWVKIDVEVDLDDSSGSNNEEAFIDVTATSADGSLADTQELTVPLTYDSGLDKYVGTYNDWVTLQYSSKVNIELKWASAVDNNGDPVTINSVEWSNANVYAYRGDVWDTQATLTNKYTRSGDYSVVEEIGTTLLGDGPTNYSDGIPSSGTLVGDDIERGNFRIRGTSENILLQELATRERVNMRRGFLRNIRADLWINYTPSQLLSYDGKTWFFLGGTFNAKDSRWDASIIALEYDGDTTGDVFQEIVESGGDPTGTATTSGSSTSSGLTLVDADSRYLQILNNLSDVDDVPTARTNLDVYSKGESDSRYLNEVNNLSDLDNLATSRQNLGVEIGVDVQGWTQVLQNVSDNNASADLDLSSVAINGDDVFGLFYRKDEIDASINELFPKAGGEIFGDVLTHADVLEPNFVSGWITDGGQGYSIFQNPDASSQWDAEFNNLLIRGRMKVFEFIVKQIAVLGGTEILSVAVAEVDSSTGSAGNETIEITDPRGFGGTSLAQDDLVLVQRVDINDTTIVKSEYRTVSSISGTSVNLSPTVNAPSPVDPIEENDIIVAYGNKTDSARQNIIYRNVDASSGKVINRLQEGVDSYSKFNSPESTTRFAYGDLNGFSDYNSQTWGVFLGDNANEHIVQDVDNGIRFMSYDDQADSFNEIAKLSASELNVAAGNLVATKDKVVLANWTAQGDDFESVTSGTGLTFNSAAPKIDLLKDNTTRVAIGPDETVPSITYYQQDTPANLSVDLSGNSTGAYDGIDSSAAYSTNKANITTVVLWDFSANLNWDDVDRVSVFLQGRVGTNSWENITNRNYILEPLPSSSYIIGNTYNYDEIRVQLILRLSSSTSSTQTVEMQNIELNQQASAIAVNDDGIYQRISSTQIVPYGEGGSGGGGFETSEIPWGSVTDKPFATLGADFSVSNDELQISGYNPNNWDDAYTHSQTTTGNPHSISASDLDGGISASDISDVEPVSSTEKSEWDTAYSHSQTTTGNPHSLDTGDVPEGSNLYFTDERVDDRVSNLLQGGTGLSFSYDDTGNTLTGNVSLSTFDTGDLSEGSNLYFTDERAQDAVGTILTDNNYITWTYDDANNQITGVISLSQFDTGDLSEGSNLYYTDERVDDRVSNLLVGGTGLSYTYDDAGNTLTGNVSLTPFSTDDLTEGSTNLYYTDQRVKDVVSGANTFQTLAVEDTVNFDIIQMDGDDLLHLFYRKDEVDASINELYPRAGGLIQGDMQVEGVANFQSNALFESSHEADNFSLGSTDFSGTGWQGTYQGDFNIQNLVVREAARFRELIIDQLSIIAGSDLRSVARGKIESVDPANNYIYLENPNNRSATRFTDSGDTNGGDFFWVKAIDIDNGEIKDLKGQITNVTIEYDGVTYSPRLTLDTTVAGGTHDGGTTDISSLGQGDVIVQRGHPTDTDRQNLIYTTVSDTDAPVQKWFTGVDSLAAFETDTNITTQIGNLTKLADDYSYIDSGDEGLFTQSGFFTGRIEATDGIFTGTVTAGNNVSIGNFGFDRDHLQLGLRINDNNYWYMYEADSLADYEEFRVGDSTYYIEWNIDGNAKLEWEAENTSLLNGTFTASNAVITGEITANTGEIADWTINGSALEAGDMSLIGGASPQILLQDTFDNNTFDVFNVNDLETFPTQESDFSKVFITEGDLGAVDNASGTPSQQTWISTEWALNEDYSAYIDITINSTGNTGTSFDYTIYAEFYDTGTASWDSISVGSGTNFGINDGTRSYSESTTAALKEQNYTQFRWRIVWTPNSTDYTELSVDDHTVQQFATVTQINRDGFGVYISTERSFAVHRDRIELRGFREGGDINLSNLPTDSVYVDTNGFVRVK